MVVEHGRKRASSEITDRLFSVVSRLCYDVSMQDNSDNSMGNLNRSDIDIIHGLDNTQEVSDSFRARKWLLSVFFFSAFVFALTLAFPADAVVIQDTTFPSTYLSPVCTFGDTAQQKCGFDFMTTGTHVDITGDIYLAQQGTAVIDPVNITLYSDLGNQPNIPVAGWSVWSDPTILSTLVFGGTFDLFNYDLSGPALTPATKYWLVVSINGPDVSGGAYAELNNLDVLVGIGYETENGGVWSLPSIEEGNLLITDDPPVPPATPRITKAAPVVGK